MQRAVTAIRKRCVEAIGRARGARRCSAMASAKSASTARMCRDDPIGIQHLRRAERGDLGDDLNVVREREDCRLNRLDESLRRTGARPVRCETSAGRRRSPRRADRVWTRSAGRTCAARLRRPPRSARPTCPQHPDRESAAGPRGEVPPGCARCALSAPAGPCGVRYRSYVNIDKTEKERPDCGIMVALIIHFVIAIGIVAIIVASNPQIFRQPATPKVSVLEAGLLRCRHRGHRDRLLLQPQICQ